MANKVNLFTDVIGLLKDLNPTSISKNYKDNNKRKRSLKQRSGDFILQFPLVTSDTIEQDTVELMRNQLELERAFEFDFVLTNSPLQTFDPKDPTSFMSDLHNNVNLAESTKEDIKRSNDYLLETPEEKFNMNSLNDMTITREEMKELLNESNSGYAVEVNGVKYDIRFDINDFELSKNTNKTYNLEILEVKDGKGKEFKFNNMSESSNRNINSVFDGRLKSINGDTIEKNSELKRKFSENYKGQVTTTIKDTERDNFGAKVTIDKEKINASLPTTITTTINYVPADKNGNPLPASNYIQKDTKFGVKTVVHVVKTEDIIFYLSDKSRGSNLVTKLVKFTTGELRLVRDLLLDSEKVKKIAQDSKKGRSGTIWNKLNSLYSVNKASGIAKSAKANYIPTTALMITIDEANEVKRKTGVDLLSDRRAAKKIYNEFFLLDFIILDQTRELVYKYLPDHNKFEVIKENKLGAYKVKNNQKDLTSEMLEKLLKR